MYQQSVTTETRRELWKKGELIGEKPPLKLKEIWVIKPPASHRGQSRNRPVIVAVLADSNARPCTF